MRGKNKLLGGERGPLAVSGVGILSAAGRGMAPLRDGLARRKSFLTFLSEASRGPAGDVVPLVGIVPDDQVFAGNPPGETAAESNGSATSRGRSVRVASTALADAIEMSRCASPEGGPTAGRLGIALGTALGAVEDVERGLPSPASLEAAGLEPPGSPDRVSELSFALFADRIAAGAVEAAGRCPGPASLFDGPRWVFSATCVSGLCALEQAAAEIALDRSDVMAVGGIDTLSGAMLAGFGSLGITSRCGTLRPFDSRHDGVAIGEAACFVVVEPLARARERRVTPAACILSQSLQSDAYHLTTPDPSGRGMARAITRAMADAGLTGKDLGGILVTAAGSAVYDRMLCRAVEEALGAPGREVPVTTWEPAVGHVLAATGVTALAFAADVLATGILPPVYPVEGPGESRSMESPRQSLDPECRLDYVLDGPRKVEAPVLLALVVGFGGQNGAVILASPAEGGPSTC